MQDEVLHFDRCSLHVRYLDAYRVVSRNRCFNTHILDRQLHLYIIRKAQDPADLDTDLRTDFVLGYSRTDMGIHQIRPDIKVLQHLDEQLTLLRRNALVVVLPGYRRHRIQQIRLRQMVRLLYTPRFCYSSIIQAQCFLLLLRTADCCILEEFQLFRLRFRLKQIHRYRFQLRCMHAVIQIVDIHEHARYGFRLRLDRLRFGFSHMVVDPYVGHGCRLRSTHRNGSRFRFRLLLHAQQRNMLLLRGFPARSDFLFRYIILHKVILILCIGGEILHDGVERLLVDVQAHQQKQHNHSICDQYDNRTCPVHQQSRRCQQQGTDQAAADRFCRVAAEVRHDIIHIVEIDLRSMKALRCIDQGNQQKESQNQQNNCQRIAAQRIPAVAVDQRNDDLQDHNADDQVVEPAQQKTQSVVQHFPDNTHPAVGHQCDRQQNDSQDDILQFLVFLLLFG